MIAIQTNETINVQLGTAVSVDVILSYVDHTGTTVTANGSVVNISTTANTTILPSPAALGTLRQLKGLSIRNRDVLTTELTIKKNVAAVEYSITAPIALRAGESLQYTDQAGFLLHDSNGRTHQAVPCGNQPASGIYFPVLFGPYVYTTTGVNPTGYRILSLGGETVATYIGRAPKATSRVTVRFRACNSSITATWGEIAVATGTPIMGAGTTLTVRGFNGSNNAIANSYSGAQQGSVNGIYTTLVPISPGQTLNEGDDVWILMGNQAATGCNVRCLAVPDELQTGLCLNATTRPSLNVGIGVAYALDGVANLSPYISVSYT